MEKTDLNITVTEAEKWQYILEQSFSALSAAADEQERQRCIRQAGLYGCLALKNFADACAEKFFVQLLQTAKESSDNKILLIAIRDMLSVAARLRKKTLFCSWLRHAEAFLAKMIIARDNPDEVSGFLQSMAFIVCDRRNNDAFAVMRNLMVLFVSVSVNKAVLKNFVSEWTNLIARMGRRKWFDVSDFLLSALFKALWRKKDSGLLTSTLLQLHLHVQMYCRWDGAENAFIAYRKLQYFYFIIAAYAGNKRFAAEKRYCCLRAVLLNVRELIANMARTIMQDELQIIRIWHDCLLREAGDRMKKRVKIFVQLEINYWSMTKPKTSRKQLAYLADLLQPDLINADYAKILAEIC